MPSDEEQMQRVSFCQLCGATIRWGDTACERCAPRGSGRARGGAWLAWAVAGAAVISLGVVVALSMTASSRAKRELLAARETASNRRAETEAARASLSREQTARSSLIAEGARAKAELEAASSTIADLRTRLREMERVAAADADRIALLRRELEAAGRASDDASLEAAETARKERAREAARLREEGPADERAVVALYARFRATYASSHSEIAKSEARAERRDALSRTLQSLSVRDWVGTVTEISTNGDGKVILSVRLPNSTVEVKTWNNALSDIGSGTLIERGSQVYEGVRHLSRGSRVRFSGTFFSCEKDYLRETSATEGGGMDEPELLFRFSSVAGT